MLDCLQEENKEKQKEIARLQEINDLKDMVDGPIKSGNL